MQIHRQTRHCGFAAAALAACALTAGGCGISLSAQEEARNQWTRRYAVAPGATFEIQNTNGRIQIDATDGEAIEVTAERIVKAGTRERAAAVLESYEIRETASADRVLLDSRRQSLHLGFGAEFAVNYTVKLPRATSVRLETANGDVHVSRLAGELHVRAINGRIEATGLENGADVDTTNGAVTLDFAKLGDQGVRCEATNGAITVALPRDANADVSARVTNGAISTGDLVLSRTEESRRRVEGRVGAGGARVRLETLNGAIRLRGR
jgi:hypothetical protein